MILTTPTSVSTTEAQTIFEQHLLQLEKAFVAKDVSAIEGLFLPHGWLREWVLSLHFVDRRPHE